MSHMSDHIEAILFDMGGTLRKTVKREEGEKKKILRQILDILGDSSDLGKFMQLLDQRADAYQRWSDETLLEANEYELWTRWMLPDWPAEMVRKNALTFNRIWRDALAERIMLPESRDVILRLFRSGYRLGLVSNTTSSQEAPNALDTLGIAGCFEVIVLSCQVGIRKYDPAILLNATEKMGIDPGKCAYVGDHPMRDVVAARKAGFGKTVIIHSPYKPPRTFEDPGLVPDHQIHNLLELFEIFPPLEINSSVSLHRNSRSLQTDKSRIYDASLSTMWGIDKFPELGDFFLAAGRLGFPKVELNHRVNSRMLGSVDMGLHEICSIHEPCPADISVATLKERDWMISSIDEDCRQQGVASIKRSIELARALSVPTVVVHSGHVSLDMVDEKKIRHLYQASLAGTDEYQETKGRMIDKRSRLSGACLEAVVRSLKELLDFASRLGIRLGLENRYHYFDIPTPDEMSTLLALAGPERLGVIYDVGHATVLDRLGFFPDRMWLESFSSRIFGSHLHDVIGIADHYAPGLGNVDFHRLSGYLPKDSFKTIEVMSFNTPEQIVMGMKELVYTDCVRMLGTKEQDYDLAI
jgi:FMN phosphatase YigB (HAD superfamily)/sugar phosphate isomerase/epimerase